MDATQKVYFSKVILSNAFLIGGRPVQFESLPGNEGIIALDPQKDGDLIRGLSDAAQAGVGGILQISAQEYQQKKTQAPFRKSAPRRQNDIRPLPPPASPFSRTTEQKKEPVAAAAAEPEPLAPAAASEPVAAPVPAEGAAALSESEMQALQAAESDSATPSEPVFKPTTRRISRKQTDPVPAE